MKAKIGSKPIRLLILLVCGCLSSALIGFWTGQKMAAYHWPSDGNPWPRGITLAKVLRQRGISPDVITSLRVVGDESSFTTGKIAVITNAEELEWIWQRMVETAEPYVFWESSGSRRVEVYTRGRTQAAAVLYVNATDSTCVAGDTQSFMCHGLHELAMDKLTKSETKVQP